MMWLRRIELKNFKRFIDFEARFSPGINVVKGPRNEMGKSTLLEGIIAALFYSPKSTAREIKDYVSWGSNRQFRTCIDFEDNGTVYLLEKDFDRGTIRFCAADGREELDTVKEISEKMAELLGTRSDKLFLSSSCIRQSQVTEISSGEKEITASLEEIVSGGRESTLASQVIQKLDNKIAEMKRGLDKLAKNPGTVAILKNKIQETARRHDEVAGEVSRVEAEKAQLVELSKLLAEVKEQYESARALLEKNKQRRDIEAVIERLTRDYNSAEELLSRTRSLEEEFKKADEALRAIDGFQDRQQVAECRRKLDGIDSRRKDIRNDLAQREEELAEGKERLHTRRPVTFLGSAKSIAAAVAILTGGIVGVLIGPFYLLAVLVLGAILLAICARARAALIRDRTSISSLEERIQRMKESLAELNKEEQALLAEAGCNTVAEFAEKERTFSSRLEQKEGARYRLEGILSGRTIEDIDKQRLEIGRNLAVEQLKLTADMIETRLSPEQYIELERKIQTLEARKIELENRKRRCEVIIEQARFDVEDQVKLKEELESLEKALEREERKVQVYELARRFIYQARTEVLSSIEEALEKEIQRHLVVFTDGRYEQVRVHKEDLDFSVYSDEKKDWARPEDLSGGVIDEFYLAFRLALVKLIFGDKKPPLILDDPFVNFDSVRLANTLDFFKRLASDYQIIIFTLSDSYDGVADNIILLGGK
ncbi:MAG: AAA family ATPase [Dehalococcoidia bacterium]